MASIWEKAILILAENLNSGCIYLNLITAVKKLNFAHENVKKKSKEGYF